MDGGKGVPLRRRNRLTARFVETVAVPGKYHDNLGHGLFLRVSPGGSRQWVQRVFVNGRRVELGLGAPPLVTLAEAREVALANKRKVRDGGEPVRRRADAPKIPSFEAAAREVHRIHTPTWRSASHAKQFLASLEQHVFPVFGHLKVSAISTADLLAVLTPLWTVKHETARRLRQRIGMVLTWAIAQGWRSDNPAEAVGAALPKVERTHVHYRALHHDQVGTFLVALRGSDLWLGTRQVLEFILLTAVRSGEARGARWAEIDLDSSDGPVWTVPAARMKSGRSHRVPLSPRAVALLVAARELGPGGVDDLVFPAVKGGMISAGSLSNPVKALGFAIDVHGFRTTFRTWAQEETDYPAEVAEVAIAHVTGDAVARAYARSDLFARRRQLMEDWAAHVEARVGSAGVSCDVKGSLPIGWKGKWAEAEGRT